MAEVSCISVIIHHKRQVLHDWLPSLIGSFHFFELRFEFAHICDAMRFDHDDGDMCATIDSRFLVGAILPDSH